MPRGSSSSSGPVPQRDSQRRRKNKPKSYGAATPTTGAATAKRPQLGIASPMQMIVDLWDALQDAPESKFYSAADWQRVRLELAYGNSVLREISSGYVQGLTKDGDPIIGNKINAGAWARFQDALTELLVSPAAKRRAGIELKPPTDPDEVEADRVVADMQQKLRAV